jgi:hypothetical protein
MKGPIPLKFEFVPTGSAMSDFFLLQIVIYFVWFVAGQNNAVRSFNVEGNFVERGQHELQHLLSTHEMESSEFLTF